MHFTGSCLNVAPLKSSPLTLADLFSHMRKVPHDKSSINYHKTKGLVEIQTLQFYKDLKSRVFKSIMDCLSFVVHEESE